MQEERGWQRAASLAQVKVEPKEQQEHGQGDGDAFEPAGDLRTFLALVRADGIFVVRNFGEEVKVPCGPNLLFINRFEMRGRKIGSREFTIIRQGEDVPPMPRDLPKGGICALRGKKEQ